MTLWIDTNRDGRRVVFRLIGRIRGENLGDVEHQITGACRPVVLDLDQVTLVDVDVVRFLSGVEAAGIELRHCPRFIRTWINTERDQGG
jgi:anti-anti-sigma regulatory factor